MIDWKAQTTTLYFLRFLETGKSKFKDLSGLYFWWELSSCLPVSLLGREREKPDVLSSHKDIASIRSGLHPPFWPHLTSIPLELPYLQCSPLGSAVRTSTCEFGNEDTIQPIAPSTSYELFLWTSAYNTCISNFLHYCFFFIIIKWLWSFWSKWFMDHILRSISLTMLKV